MPSSAGPIRTAIAGVDAICHLRNNDSSMGKTVVLLHGFGANYEDLAPLGDILDPKQDWNWIYLNGIKSVDLGMHMTGRAWFPIRMAEIEAAAMRGQTIDFANICPDGMPDARGRIIEVLDSLKIPTDHLVLGGFSQGAMMAVDVQASLPTPLRGLLLFSGTLINASQWEKNLPKFTKTPVFQSHGRQDPVLGYQHATRLKSLFESLGYRHAFVDFNGGHEIPMPVIQRSREYLAGLTS
jgi:phospholipase/carboxylesterase